MKAFRWLLCFILLAPAMALAASPEVPGKDLVRYYTVGSNSSTYSGKEEARFYFNVDTDFCRRIYGKSGEDICFTRINTRTMTTAGKMKVSPDMPGEWHWEYDNELFFYPEKEWVPGTTYTFDFSSIMPPQVSLSGSKSFVADALKVQEWTMDWKADPASLKTMAVTGVLNFNYAMDKESVISRLRVVNNDQIGVGQPVYTWNTEATILNFSVPVLTLPRQQSPLNMVLEAGYQAASGGNPGKTEALEYGVPGKDRLFAFNEVTLATTTNAKFQAEQILSLDFSMNTNPARLLPHVKALLLPRQRVQSEEADKKGPYRWDDLSEITPEVLAQAEELKLTPAGEADAFASRINYRFEAEPGRGLFITVSRGAPGIEDLVLEEDSTALVTVPRFKEELRVMQKGAILALPGEKKLSLYSRNLDSINYTVAQVRPEFINLFFRLNYNNFSDPDFYAVGAEDLSIFHEGTIPLARKKASDAQFSVLDLAPVLASPKAPASGKGMFVISLNGYRGENRQVGQRLFVLVTDLGIIKKDASDGSASVFVASLAGGKAAAGVTVEVLGANGLPIFSGLTNEGGRVDLPSFSGMSADKAPTALVATLGEDKALLNMLSSEGNQDTSAFDVSGNYVGQGMSAMLFAQRGMFRPGETLYFGYLVKESSWKALGDLPLAAKLTDPRGSQVEEKKFTLSGDGLGEVFFETVPTAPTGAYHLDLWMGDSFLASADVMVQEFEPDTQRLNVRIDPLPGKGWLKPENITLQAQLVNLFGTPAPERRVKAVMSMVPASMHFDEYPDWIFQDPESGEGYNQDVPLPEKRTDENGEAVFKLPLEQYHGRPYRMRLTAQGFEAGGGRAVTASASALVSSLDAVVGWRSSANLDYLRQNGPASVDFMAVGQNLSPRAMSDLSLEIEAVTWVKTLVRNEDGQYVYENTPRSKVLKKQAVNLAETGFTQPLETANPGQYVLLLKNDQGRCVARVAYRVAGEASAQMDSEIAPSLQLRLNKSDYQPGEDVEFSLVLPYSGTGLITIERERVETYAWFKGKAGESVQRITLPANFEGKGYVNVSYFRDIRDKDVFAKPLAYAIAPFTVNMAGRDMGLEIKAPAKSRTGQPMSFEVKAKTSGRAIVYAVDEGILQITRYKTPDPLEYFLGNRALEVNTIQYMHLLMPEYSLFQNALKAFGGGEEGDFSGLGQNPFRREGDKPAVFWMGIVNVGPEGTMVEVTPPPSFSGQLRIMAVGCGKSSLGSAQTSTLVQADVVILPNLPYFVAPGDTFTASLALTDMSGQPQRNVTLTADPGNGMVLADAASKRLTLTAGREQRVDMVFKAGEEPGGVKITFKVTPDGENPVITERPVGLSVRPATPRTTESVAGIVTANSTLPFSRKLYPQFAEWNASISTAPLPMAQAMINYLYYYPYGCTEQITSAAFPSLALLRMPEFAPPGPDYTPEELKKKVQNTITNLGYRHDGDGNLSAWPSGSSMVDDPFYAVYVADFLVSAQEAGMAVPSELKRRVLNNVESFCSGRPYSMYEARLMAWGAWVLTRTGTLTTSTLSNLSYWLRENKPGWEKDVTAAFMAGCWKMMRQDQEAERLIASAQPRLDYAPRLEWPFNTLSSRSMYMILVARHFPERLNKPEMQGLLDSILEQTAMRRYDTFSAAQGARAILEFAKGRAADLQGLNLAALDDKNQPIPGENAKTRAMLSFTLKPEDAAKARALEITGQRPGQPWYWQITSTGFDAVLPTQAVEQGISVRREFLNLDGTPATSFSQGDEMLVKITARSLEGTGEGIDNVALVDLLPGALELVRTTEVVLPEAAPAAPEEDSEEAYEDNSPEHSDVAVVVDLHEGNDEADEMPMDVIYQDKREDRITVFANLKDRPSTFVYKVRVTFKGDFVLPPLAAGAMYQPWLKAMTKPERMVVE